MIDSLRGLALSRLAAWWIMIHGSLAINVALFGADRVAAALAALLPTIAIGVVP